MNEELIARIREEAIQDKVPIMEDEGIEYVRQYLKDHQIRSLLEIGTAVGYSSIVFASYVEDLQIVTLEKDEQRYHKALENIRQAGLSERIHVILTDARQFTLDEKFDCLFLDGPKAHNGQLLKNYQKNLNENGIIIVDDVYFHGMIDGPEENVGRRLKPLVRKLKAFRETMLKDPNYDSEYLQLGDGLLICKKKEKDEDELCQ